MSRLDALARTALIGLTLLAGAALIRMVLSLATGAG